MLDVDFTRRDLRSLSKTDVAFFTSPFPGQKMRELLLVKFSGEIQGRVDCLSMLSKALSGILLLEPSGLILDLGDIQYLKDLSAEIEMLFQTADVLTPQTPLPFVLLASKENVSKIRAIAKNACLIESRRKVFVSQEKAVHYLLAQCAIPSISESRNALQRIDRSLQTLQSELVC